MKRALLWLLPIAVMIFGCGTTPPKTVEVSVPVSVPCAVVVTPPKAYSDAAAYVKAAPNLAERVRLLLLGRNERDAYIMRLEASAAGCLLEPAADTSAR